MACCMRIICRSDVFIRTKFRAVIRKKSFPLIPNVLFSTSRVVSIKQQEQQLDGEEFRVLVIPGHTKIPPKEREQRREHKEVPPPRYKSMKTDQDWTDVWPTAHTFKWSVVPFPVRQGFIEKSENDGVTPSKYANAELMKIPNFLHLTPDHVKKHCAAIKQFCNKWPDGLETDEQCDKHFPIEVITRDYIVDSSSIRDDRSHLVTVKLKLSSLELNYHAKDKLFRLAGNCFDDRTGLLTLESDRCPLKKQNYDYAMYLLTALYTESWKTETWESEKTLGDMEKYFWDINPSKTTLMNIVKTIKQKSKNSGDKSLSYVESLSENATDEEIVSLNEVQTYKETVEYLHNEEEDFKALDRYKKAVKQLLISNK